MSTFVFITGGEGKRVKAVSKGLPKSLIKVGNKTIIEHQLENLNQFEKKKKNFFKFRKKLYVRKIYKKKKIKN